MRALRTLFLPAALLGLAPLSATAQWTPAYILDKFKPTVAGVDVDSPADKAAVDACKLETVTGPDGKSIGKALRDGQGKLLRKFVDTNGAFSQRAGEEKKFTHLDQWSYYKDGFEVYREVDTDEDGFTDEARWLNTAGSRVALLKLVKGAGYHVASWKRLSAEEASKVLVQGLVSGDADLLATILASPEELKTLGLPASAVEQAAKLASGRAGAIGPLRKELKGWDASSVWSRFDGSLPHVIPADTTPRARPGGEVSCCHENTIVFAQPGDPAKGPPSLPTSRAGDVVKVGEVWKFVNLR